MALSKEQKVVVLLEQSSCDNTLIKNGIKIASIFNKELCLVSNVPNHQNKDVHPYEDETLNVVNSIKLSSPEIKVSSLCLSEKWSKLPDLLSDDYEGIFIVANKMSFKDYRKTLAATPIPILFVREGSEIEDYNRLVQPIDKRKENSDGTLWSSYFGRYNAAEIVIIAANDQSKKDKQKLAKSLKSTTKLYSKFSIQHKIYRGLKSSFRNTAEGLELALASDCNLLVILGSSFTSPLDLLLGLPESKIIDAAGNLPVLVINPRKDNYILCE